MLSVVLNFVTFCVLSVVCSKLVINNAATRYRGSTSMYLLTNFAFSDLVILVHSICACAVMILCSKFWHAMSFGDHGFVKKTVISMIKKQLSAFWPFSIVYFHFTICYCTVHCCCLFLSYLLCQSVFHYLDAVVPSYRRYSWQVVWVCEEHEWVIYSSLIWVLIHWRTAAFCFPS